MTKRVIFSENSNQVFINLRENLNFKPCLIDLCLPCSTQHITMSFDSSVSCFHYASICFMFYPFLTKILLIKTIIILQNLISFFLLFIFFKEVPHHLVDILHPSEGMLQVAYVVMFIACKIWKL
jgi:hypothetical protein